MSSAASSGDSAASSRSPIGSARASSEPRSFWNRASETSTGPWAGNGSPSATGVKARSAGIEAFLEWTRADPAIGVQQALTVLPKLRVGGDHVFDGIGNAFLIEAVAQDVNDRGVLRARTAEQDLVVLHAFAIDAQDADMANVVVAARIDAAGNLDLELAEIVLAFEIGKAARNLLGDIDRPRIGEVAVIEPGAGNYVGGEAMVRRGEVEIIELAPQGKQIALAHMREHEILLMRDADFRLPEFIHDVGQRIHLVGRAVAGRLPDRLQRNRRDRVAGDPMRINVCLRPVGKVGIEIGRASCRERV